MTAIPKPQKTKKSGVAGPQLTESDYLEIGEKIGEAMKFGTEVTITIFYRKNYEHFTGLVIAADSQKGNLTLRIGPMNNIKININSVVAVN